MTGKIIEISCRAGHLDTIVSVAEGGSATVLSAIIDAGEPPRASVRLFVDEQHVQSNLDRLQTALPHEAEALILLIEVDARIRGTESDLPVQGGRDGPTREEIFNDVKRGTECDADFIILVLLATVVATIGIVENNIAVVIGAMVIAPLLGPNLALALGAALGDKELIREAIFTNAIGVCLTVGIAALLTLVWPPNLQSDELISRTHVQPASIVLALAAGIAAVQSLTAKLSNTLVGVMVAVALVPPATVLGMMIGIQNWQLAGGAGLLLAVNIASVNLAAQVVFLARGIRPRTWLAKREAQESTWVNVAFWAALLSICIAGVALL